MNSLVLPIVIPLLTAAILLLAPRRPRAPAVDFVRRLIGMAASAVSLFVASSRKESLSCRQAAGRRRSVSL